MEPYLIDRTYEKKYNEALELAREKRDIALRNGADITVKFLEEIFPELRESEDERTRKAIIELLKEIGRDDTGISENAKCMIAYLEKQKEQKPVEWSDYKDKVNIPYCSSEPEWSEEDEEMLHEADIAVVGYYRHSPKYFPKDKCEHIRTWLKSLRPTTKK